MPDIRVVFEGPKTPVQADQTPYPRSEIEACITRLWSRGLSRIPSCLALREAVLERHIDALRALKPLGWSMQWIRVENRALPEAQQVEGIYLSAWNSRTGQDRFILITARGTQQTFTLSYPVNAEGNRAQDEFQKALRSLRVSDDLNPGRAWVDQGLERIHLSDLDKLAESRDVVSQLAEIQALLVSRISVDPKSYDTYFHLGGTALMLARFASERRKQPGADLLSERLAEWLAVSKPMVQSAYKYAVDVNARDKRTPMLQGYWFEAQKL